MTTGRGEKVDYRANQLRRPPERREWWQIGGDYVPTNHIGTIVSVLPAHGNHQRNRDEHPQ